MFCLITHTVYGTSGTELMPPVERTTEYFMRPDWMETDENFRDRVRYTLLPVREKLASIPPESYSIRDTIGWRFIVAKEFNGILD
jgi:hypothetical protein